MEQKIPWQIIIKSYQNKATPDENDELNTWLQKDCENQKLFDEAFHVFAISGTAPTPLNPDLKKAWEIVDKKTHSKASSPKITNFWFRVAIAALVILSVMIWKVADMYLSNSNLSQQYAEVITLPGQKTSLILPDGTKIWLNSGSKLKYPSNYNKKERNVLLEGEAFFEVHKDITKRFRVTSGKLNVDVYGTSFNIKNYRNEETQVVTVAEGIVGITKDAREIRKLVVGEQVILDKKSNKVEFTNDNAEIVSAWKKNELTFRNTPVTEVMKSLESWYGVNITLLNHSAVSSNYTFKIKSESFKEVLDMMRIMSPFEYTINGENVEINYVTNP